MIQLAIAQALPAEANEDYVDTPGLRRKLPGILRHHLASCAHTINWQHCLGA